VAGWTPGKVVATVTNPAVNPVVREARVRKYVAGWTQRAQVDRDNEDGLGSYE
jgi:hypothetical protein